MRSTLVFVLLLGMGFHGLAQDPIKTSFEELEFKQAVDQRYTVVFLYTDWCKYCAAMKKISWRDPNIVALLNDYFYYVPFDGEQKETVTFLGRAFAFKPSGAKSGIHDLAEQLGSMEGKVAYPTTVILDPSYQIVFQHNAYLGPDELLEVLQAVPAQ